MKIFNFAAGIDNGIPVALCFEHDLVVQAVVMTELPGQCREILQAIARWDREEGLDPWSRPPPPADVLEEFRALPSYRVIIVVLEDE